MKNYTGSLLTFEQEGGIIFFVALAYVTVVGLVGVQCLLGRSLVPWRRLARACLSKRMRTRLERLIEDDETSSSSSSSSDGEDENKKDKVEAEIDAERAKIRADRELQAQFMSEL
jgi:hypothetical protein